jgi:hypothetical protein
MKRDYFLKNFGSIMVYAIFGTIIAAFTTGIMLYGLGMITTHFHVKKCTWALKGFVCYSSISLFWKPCFSLR